MNLTCPGKRRQLDKAFEALDRARQVHGFIPNSQVRTCLMCSCLNNNAVDQAMRVFEDLQRSPLGADARAVSAMVLGCVRQGQLPKACEILEKAYSRNGGAPDLGIETLTKLVQALQQNGLTEEFAIPL